MNVSHGNSLLQTACRRGAVDLLPYLVERGADVNAISYSVGGDTSWGLAVIYSLLTRRHLHWPGWALNAFHDPFQLVHYD
jgi:ankyrin repeat protein